MSPRRASQSPRSRSAASTTCVAALVTVILLIGCGKSSAPIEKQTAPVNHRQELGKLKYQRDRVRLSLSRLEDERTAIVGRMKQAGISTRSLAQHPDWRVHAQELKEVVGRIRQLEKTVAAYEQAITRMEVILRKDDRDARMRASALSDDDLDELSRIRHELDDQLRTDSAMPGAEDLELESLLDDELSR